MAEITIERLREIRKTCREIRDLQKEIDSSYYVYHSPSFSSTYQKNRPLSDPTVQALERIDSLRAKQLDLIEVMYSFEEDLSQIEDCTIRAIIRSRFINGDTWTECTKRILDIDRSDSAKGRLYRFLGLKE